LGTLKKTHSILHTSSVGGSPAHASNQLQQRRASSSVR
jgi:hypothetical protein